jgi:tetratricopeptide (TPR) repeat protein
MLDFQLDQKKLDEAAAMLTAAEKNGGMDAELLERKVRLLVAQGKKPDAVAAAGAFVDRKEDPTSADPQSAARRRNAAAAAAALAKVGADAEAAQLLESVLGPGNAPAILQMATSPASSTKAVDLCAGRVKKENGSLASAVLAAQTLTLAKAVQPDPRFEPLFARWISADPPPPTSFTSNLAVLREHQGRFDDAIAVTRKTLARVPDDVVSLNNLAWFLTAYADQSTQALEAVDRVVGKLGPIDSVLDTKGVVLLGLKRSDAAIRLLEAAVEAPSSSGASWLHLAAAYDASQRADDCRRALATAKLRGLTNLSPYDEKLLARLSK